MTGNDYFDQHCWAPQGWQCPVCGRVYSPTTPMCFYCGNMETITTTNFTINPKTDYAHKDTITKAKTEGK